ETAARRDGSRGLPRDQRFEGRPCLRTAGRERDIPGDLRCRPRTCPQSGIRSQGPDRVGDEEDPAGEQSVHRLVAELGAKTTIAPYSLRGRLTPTVAAPRTWDEFDDPAAVVQ